MWLGHVPWAGRHWALPVLTVLAPSTRYYQQREPFTKQRRHKKLTDWARQMVMSAAERRAATLAENDPRPAPGNLGQCGRGLV